MNPALILANDIIGTLSPQELVEVEYRYHNNSANEFVSMIQNLQKIAGFTVSFKQQVDTIVDNKSLRYSILNGKIASKETIIKKEYRKDKSFYDGTIVVSTEKISDEIISTNTKFLCFLKTRLSFKSHNWSIDFTARKEINELASISPTAKVYFKDDITTIEQYLEKCKKYIFSKYMVEVEYEVTHSNKDRNKIHDLVEEFNTIMQHLFIEDRNLEFSQLLGDAISLYCTSETTCRTRSIKPITTQVLGLTKNKLMQEFPLNGWYVTNKPDGLHCLVTVHANGGVYALPDKVITLVKPNTDFGNDRCVFEGELIMKSTSLDTASKSNDEISLMIDDIILTGAIVNKTINGAYEEHVPVRLIIYDVIYFDNNQYHSSDFETRLSLLDECVEFIKERISSEHVTSVGKSLIVEAKKFHKLDAPMLLGAANPTSDPNRIDLSKYEQAIDMALTDHKSSKTIEKYKVDGLIFVQPGVTYSDTKSYKWKPETENTIDFLSMLVPDQFYSRYPSAHKPGKYLYVLFVGASPTQIRGLGLHRFEFYDQIFPPSSNIGQGQNIPMHFTSPLFNPNIHYFYYGDKTIHNRIIELAPAWSIVDRIKRLGWRFIKIREDRQLYLESGEYYGNNITVAGSNFAEFVYPTTISDLKGKFSDGYFIKNHSSMYNIVTAHNSAVKGDLFNKHIRGINRLIDFASGRADFKKYRDIKLQVYALDNDSQGLLELLNRYYEAVRGRIKEFYSPELIIVECDLNQSSETTLDMLRDRKIHTRTSMKEGQKPIISADGAMCNMAIHYMVYNNKLMNNFISLIKNSIFPQSKFMCTMMDGRKIYNYLQTRQGGEWIAYEGTIRKYHLKIDPLCPMPEGASVPIELILPFSNGKLIKEYLIDVDYMIKQFAAAKFELIDRVNFGEQIGKVGHGINNSDINESDRIFIGFYIGLVFKKQ
jgi:hypothetical protein